MTDAQGIEGAPEVEGQGIRWSTDETIKQAIKQVENALAALTKLDAKREPAEVEGQPGSSVKRLAARSLEQGDRAGEERLAALKAMQPEVEGQSIRW